MSAQWSSQERFSALTIFEEKYADLRRQEKTSRAPTELLYHAIGVDLQCEVTALRKALEVIKQCGDIVAHDVAVKALAKTSPKARKQP